MHSRPPIDTDLRLSGAIFFISGELAGLAFVTQLPHALPAGFQAAFAVLIAAALALAGLVGTLFLSAGWCKYGRAVESATPLPAGAPSRRARPWQPGRAAALAIVAGPALLAWQGLAVAGVAHLPIVTVVPYTFALFGGHFLAFAARVRRIEESNAVRFYWAAEGIRGLIRWSVVSARV